MTTDVRTTWPARYYVAYDSTTGQILNWFDVWSMGSTANVPAASTMIAVAEADWNNTTTFRVPVGRGVKDGKIVDMTFTVPLKTQANTELNWISSQATMAAAMSETFTSDMKTYVKAVQAIANGTDTTSTVLPTRPTDIMS